MPFRMATYQYEKVKCGKPRCRTCPHGPYWYAYWKEGGRTRSRYVGKTLHGGASGEFEEEPPPATSPRDVARIKDPTESDFNIIGCDRGERSWNEIRKAYRRATFKHHPDRGGDPRMQVIINLAYERIRKAHDLGQRFA
jgi:hypothetical protein